MRFEDTVRKICGENWRELPLDEKDGGYGIAIVKAILDGCRCSLEDLSRYLSNKDKDGVIDTPISALEYAYRRLQLCDMIPYKIKEDRSLKYWIDTFDGKVAWSYVAGIASGYVGKSFYVSRERDALAAKEFSR